MSTTSLMVLTGAIGAVIAGVYWFLRGQSIRKGFGFTFHWWSLGDWAAGVLICTAAMLGLVLIERATGSIGIVGSPYDATALGYMIRAQISISVVEEVISRSFQLNGFWIGLGLLAVLVWRRSQEGGYLNRVEGVLVWCKWPAIGLSAALFGYAHSQFPEASRLSVFGNMLGGLMYGIAFLGGRNIWLPMGMHFGWNFAQDGLLALSISGFDAGGAWGIACRFVAIGLLLLYLDWRANWQGNVVRLDFPIPVYDNTPRAKPAPAAHSAATGA